MRYKSFLLNEGRSVPISEDKAFADIRKHCSQSYKSYMNDKIIFRGMKKKDMALFIDPKKGEPRASANTKNYYTLLLDNSPYWKNFPKRSRSMIMSNSYKSAARYGIVYEVFLYDNPTIGIAPASDIWFSFDKTLGAGNSLNYFNFALEKLFKQYDINLDDSNFKTLKKSLSKLEQELKNDKDNLSLLHILLKNWRMKKESFLDNLNSLLAPNANRFKVVGSTDLIPKKSQGQGTEMWSDSKAILLVSMLGGASGKNPDLIEFMGGK